MVIAGAGGHARELIDILPAHEREQLCLFDNVSVLLPAVLEGMHVLRTLEELQTALAEDSRFLLGTGKPVVRKKLYDLFLGSGGQPETIVAPTAFIASAGVQIEEACNIMAFAFVSNHVHLGKGVLMNTRAHVHHDVQVGSFSELSPGALLLGGVQVGSFSMIGAGAIVLPQVRIGDHVQVGAGAVVTRDVPNGMTVKGIPAQ